MQIQKNKILISALSIMLFLCTNDIQAQFGFGYTINSDMYQRYTNPSDVQDLGSSSGSTMLNLSIGPKIWLGHKSFSFSIESQIGIGVLGYDTQNFKGLGLANIPIIGQFNFKGASSLLNEQKVGFSAGGGIQYNRTELFGLREKYKSQGLERSFFPTYIIQGGAGFGLGGFVLLGYLRYGFHPDNMASSLNIGVQFDMNVRAFRKNFNNPNSSL